MQRMTRHGPFGVPAWCGVARYGCMRVEHAGIFGKAPGTGHESVCRSRLACVTGRRVGRLACEATPFARALSHMRHGLSASPSRVAARARVRACLGPASSTFCLLSFPTIVFATARGAHNRWSDVYAWVSHTGTKNTRQEALHGRRSVLGSLRRSYIGFVA